MIDDKSNLLTEIVYARDPTSFNLQARSISQ